MHVAKTLLVTTQIHVEPLLFSVYFPGFVIILTNRIEPRKFYSHSTCACSKPRTCYIISAFVFIDILANSKMYTLENLVCYHAKSPKLVCANVQMDIQLALAALDCQGPLLDWFIEGC